jgi:hypothetical protein
LEKARNCDPPLFVLSIEGLGIACKHGTVLEDGRKLDCATATSVCELQTNHSTKPDERKPRLWLAKRVGERRRRTGEKLRTNELTARRSTAARSANNELTESDATRTAGAACRSLHGKPRVLSVKKDPA